MLKYLGGSQSESNDSEASKNETDELSLDEPGEQKVSVSRPVAIRPESAKKPETEDEEKAVLREKITRLEYRITYLERIVKVSQILNTVLTLLLSLCCKLLSNQPLNSLTRMLAPFC